MHQNSIFDLTWLGNTKVVTASGDQSGIVFDLETQQQQVQLAQQHEASVKCVTCVQSSDNIIATGGREGRIVIHDIRAP